MARNQVTVMPHKHARYFGVTKKALRRFFFNQYYIPRFDLSKVFDGKTIREAMRHAKASIQSLRENGHEFFIDFSNTFELDCHAIGKVKAEKPDSDFRDAVLSHAFKDRTFTPDKSIGEEIELSA